MSFVQYTVTLMVEEWTEEQDAEVRQALKQAARKHDPDALVEVDEFPS